MIISGRATLGLTGAQDAAHERVGHDLAAGPLVAGRPRLVGLAAEHGPHRDAVLDRQQGRQLAHHVGRGTQGDATVGLGAAAPLDERDRVELVGRFASRGDDLAVAHRLEHVGVSRRSAGRPRPGRRGDRQAVSRASSIARHSVIRPARNALRVHGISSRSTSASPTCWRPRCGDSRRARATWAATARPCRSAGTPALASASRCDRSNAAVSSRLGRLGRALQLLQRPDQVDPLDVVGTLADPGQRQQSPLDQVHGGAASPTRSNIRSIVYPAADNRPVMSQDFGDGSVSGHR